MTSPTTSLSLLSLSTLLTVLACSSSPSDADGAGAGGGGGLSSGGTETGGNTGAGGLQEASGGVGVGGNDSPGVGGLAEPSAGGANIGAGGVGDSAGGSADGSGGEAEMGAGGITDGAGGDGSGGETSTDPCDSATICDDLEDGLDAAWEIQKDSNPAPEVDSSKAMSGSSSLKMTGTSQQTFVALPVPDQAFYTRAYMNFEQNTMDMTGHGWFIVAADNVTSGGESQIRFGSSGNHSHPELDMNVYAGTCGGEKTQFSDGASDGGSGWENITTDSVNLSADQWYCVEVYFNGPGNEAQVWVDGEELTGLHVTEDSMCAGWSPTYTHIKFGAGANSNIGAIWYDDIAVSTTRIGCD